MAQVEVLGLKLLEKKLKALPKNVSGKGLVAKALRKAANVIRDEARDLVPYDSSIDDGIHIRDQIKVKKDSNPEKKGHNEIMYIKPFSTRKYPVYYWRFLELGTKHIDKSRFMTKAFESKKFEALGIFKKELAKIIERETKKLNR